METITEQIQQAIEKADHVAVICHVDPDGDAFGSLTAVGSALSNMGKKVTLLCDNKTPKRFTFLPLSDAIQQHPDAGMVYDLAIAVDCGDAQRMGKVYQDLLDPKPFLINIDHHITNTRFGDINLVGETAVSATDVLYDLFAEMNIPMTQELAVCLLTGLVTDTLAFRTDGVTGRTLKIAGELVEAGADLSLITMKTMNLKPMSTMRLWQAGLNKVRSSGGLIWTTITKEERKASNHMSAGSSGLVNFLANIDQAAMGAVLMDVGNNEIRVGFRCRPPYDVAEVALNLGGGGHALASGCTLEGPLDKAESLVVEMCKEAIRQQRRDSHE